ncbi:hypothetical protein BGZ74_010760 [Mortierella antarctica]|nr:hypothetical protein BGZ74_010760 [Mortierella antarctica]
MNFTILVVTFVALAQAAPLINNGGQAVPGSYIVALKNGQTAASFTPRFNSIAQRQNGRGGRKPTISRTYENFSGFAAILNDASLKELLASETLTTLSKTPSSLPSALRPPWGLTRISQHVRDLTQPYYYNNAPGLGITAYVIDTGINLGRQRHRRIEDIDDNGHGTHVASTIRSTK